MGFDNSGWVLTHACLSERDIREGAISMRGGLNKDPMTRIVRKLISFLVKRALKSRRVTEMALGDYFAKDEALWLPKGSVRAIMALGLIGGSIYLAISTSDLTTLIGLAGAAVGYYYGGKKESEPAGGNGKE